MSVPSKSIDKNKRYAGVKANDFVNKTRTNERSRAVAPSQGWANLGKINSRRIPPPANVPSMKSETGVTNTSCDPILSSSGTCHGWTANNNQISSTNSTQPVTSSKPPTQQQLDSLPANGLTSLTTTQTSSTLASDLDKPRSQSSWNNITPGTSHDQPPNLLAYTDFPRLATQDNKSSKSTTENSNNATTTTANQGPVFRPANLSSWKEGGGRVQPISTDTTKDSNENNNLSSMPTPILSNSNNANLHSQPMQNSTNNSLYMRMYPSQQQTSSQTWNYNVANPYHSYGPNQSTSMNSSRQQTRVSTFGNHPNQSQGTRGQHTSADYKTPTILRNKDIDDLSKLTDNVTWASASQVVNYEEKIRFSDDEDAESTEINKSRRYHSHGQSRSSGTHSNQNRSLQTTTRSRLLQDDEHVKQLQDDKNCEMISTLTVAKQRRDEQERHLRPKTYEDSSSQRNSKFFDDNKQTTKYEIRSENLVGTSQTEPTTLRTQNNNGTLNRPRHETTDTQSFTMKSWSDQMDSFNYTALHEKSTGHADVDDQNDEPTGTTNNVTSTLPIKYSRSRSESSSQSQLDHETTANRSKHFPLSTRKQTKTPGISSRKQAASVIDYFDNHAEVQLPINSREQFTEWDDSTKSSSDFVSNDQRYQSSYNNDHRRSTKNFSEDSTRPVESAYENNRIKMFNKGRSNVSRLSEVSSTKTETKSNNKKTQPVWRPLSPTRPVDLINDPTPQESISFKSQIKSNETSGNSNNDRRHNTMAERKTRYSSTTTPINTASIPPLMSVRSEVPTQSATVNTKHFKSGNNLHYAQRNDFYNETSESAWANDDDYYEDDNGYYDSNITAHSRHHPSMGYHSNHRGFTALGSYGRYRRGGVLRHQQQYPSYSSLNAATAQVNTNFGSKSKKTAGQRTTNPKKETESLETTKLTTTGVIKTSTDETLKKSSVWSAEPQSNVIDEIPIIKSIETTTVINNEIEPTKEMEIIPSIVKPLLEIDTDAVLTLTAAAQIQSESSSANMKKTTSNNNQKKTNQDHRQQMPRHRTTYERSVQDYESMPMTNHNYYGNNHRNTRGGREHDLSSIYYYGHSQQHYHNQYNYSHDQYHQTRVNSRVSKRGSLTKNSERQPTKSSASTGSNTNSKSTHVHHHSASDNEQKEGEEWETASESSTNMRNGHSEIVLTQTVKPNLNEIKSIHQDRTPPKKSFANQRPLNSRHTENSLTHRRAHTLHERGSKTTRSLTHRSTRISSNIKSNSPQKSEIETKSLVAVVKKDLHRHSLDGYDLNNVAGVVKIETLPAGALEEEGSGFDDDGEEFCLVMSKRDRKEQKAAQLSKQNALEATHQNSTTNLDTVHKLIGASSSTETTEQVVAEKSSNDATNQRSRNGKSLPPRFNSKSSNQTSRQHNSKGDHQNASMYYYDQNSYYYYNQNQYYDQDSYYNYGNYNSSHRQTTARRKTRQTQNQENPTTVDHPAEKKHDGNLSEKSNSLSGNVMSHIDMWDPHTENTLTTNSKKFIEKSTHDRKFNNEIVSSSNETSLALPQRSTTELQSHSSMSKTNENIARTIKPPGNDGKSDRDNKKKSNNFDKNDTISSLAPTQLFEKTPFLDYDDKQSIGAPNDDYNQKINSLKTIWDISDQANGQLEQTINTMVAMKQQQQQQQENPVSSTSNAKSETYVKETIPVSTVAISGPTNNISAVNNDEATKKTTVSTGASSTMNAPTTYATNPTSNKNEQKNICTVKPTQQVAPNIQDPADVSAYSPFPVAPMPSVLSQPPLPQQQQQQQQQQAQQHLLSQATLNPVHQQHSYQLYDNILAALPQQAQQQQFNRYPPQNFPYRNTNMYMQAPPSVPNTNSIYHHTSQGSIAPPQNNALPPPQMHNYTSSYMMDHGGHTMAQPPPPAYMNNQLMSGRPPAGPYYRATPQQQLPTPPGPPYGTQDPLAHGGFYPPYFQAPNSNAPPVAHNIYTQNEGFHPGHPAMFARGGSIDRADHSLMSQSLSRSGNYSSTSSNQPTQQVPPSLLSQTLKSFPTSAQTNLSTNQPPFYPPQSQTNQFVRQPMPIGAMTTNNTRQQTPQVPSLMSGFTKNFPNHGNNSQSLFQTRQPLITPQPNNNRPSYHHPQYSSYSKSTGPNDDNMKPKHI